MMLSILFDLFDGKVEILGRAIVFKEGTFQQ